MFFMATNFEDRFDAAIKRAGRFDLLLCMGPPTWREKIDRLYRVYGLDDPEDDDEEGVAAVEPAVRAGQLIEKYLETAPNLRDRLSLYTFGEYKAFLRKIGDEQSIGNTIGGMGALKFRALLRKDSEYVMLKRGELRPLLKALKCTSMGQLEKRKFTLKELENREVTITPIVRYFCDRQQSKEQH